MDIEEPGRDGMLPLKRRRLSTIITSPAIGPDGPLGGFFGFLPSFCPDDQADVAQLVRRHPDGREEHLPFEPRIYGALDVLPDGSRLAIEVFDGATDSHVEVLDLKTGNRQVVGDDTRRSQPIWSVDGAGLCLTTQVDSTYNIVEYPIDSVEAPTVLLSSRQRLSPWDWSGDGNLLVLTERGSDGVGNGALKVWDRRTGTFSPQAQPAASYLWSAAMSPDDRYIAYTQVGDAGSEVYVVPYPATGKRWLVSAGTGEEPLWLEHGKALVFRRGQGWYKVTYDDAGGFRASAPELLFEGPYINIGGMEYRVLADGSLILMVSANTRDSADHLDIVVGWDRELTKALGDGTD